MKRTEVKEERTSTDSCPLRSVALKIGGMEPWLEGNAEPKGDFLKACLDSMEGRIDDAGEGTG